MRCAFSLVELSIVLVILGLLTGGILAGQALIRGAELRAITSEYSRYATATYGFRDKYFALPGDMPNAQAIWGVAHATPATCKTTASTDSKTCNGDGDGLIDPNPAGSNEAFRFWQHLANAGLIEGKYDGIAHGSTVFSSTTDNVPQSRFPQGMWYIRAQDSSDGEAPASKYTINYGNAFLYGGYSVDAAPRSSLLKPEELWNIDLKLDDGRPAYGKVIARSSGSITRCTTSTSNSDFTGDYKLSDPTVQCSMYIRL